MALGFPIGFSTRLSMNNNFSQYISGFGARSIHISLLGDPTLRMHPVLPPSNLFITEQESHVMLSWDASAEQNPEYHIFRKSADALFFERITQDAISSTSYVDSCLMAGTEYSYLVKTLKLEESASGSYYNLSQGVRGSIEVTAENSVTADFEFELNGGQLQLENLSVNADQYLWDFGDGNTSEESEPFHLYTESDSYTVTLYAWNACTSDTLSIEIGEVTRLDGPPAEAAIQIFPNPGSGDLFIRSERGEGGTIRFYSLGGGLLYETPLLAGDGQWVSGLEDFGQAVLILQLQFETGISKAYRIIVN
jgi:hypothetical protein